MHNFSICFKNDTLTSNNTIVKLRDANSTNFKSRCQEYARIPSKLTLLPNESRVINLKLNNNVQIGDNVIFRPSLNRDNLEILEQVCTINSENFISVPITNVTSHTIPLNKNMRLGTISTYNSVRDMEKIRQLRREELRESDFDISHLDADTRSRLLKLLFEFSDIFSKRLYTIGRTDALTPIFTVDKENLPSTRPYTVPQALQGELKKQLDELETANLIEKSNSHISFPLLLVKKKNPSGNPELQQHRVVIDYRQLNTHLKYPRHKLPIINHLLENLRGDKYFSSLDLSSSFWQVPLKPEDRDITSFSSPFGCYRFTVMPQGLSSSPETFAKLADQILGPISHLKYANYIDDFLIGSADISQMLTKLRKLFERFRLFGLTLNPSKCSFLLKKINFVGHELTESGIKPVDDNIKRILDFPVPNTARKVRRFVGMLGYFRRFIPQFSKLSAPLTDLIRKRQRFKWTNEAQIAFDALKLKLSQSPILIHPDYNKEFILSTDSSDYALGAFLGQRDETNTIRPIAYFSKKLNDAQRRYIIMEKELLAIVESVKSFKYYLYGRPFIIRCDNATLTKLSKLESPGNRVTRWISYLADFNYKFELIKSSENKVADALSRDFFVNTVQIDMPTADELKIAQRKDNSLLAIIEQLETSSVPKHLSSYSLLNGLLMHSTTIYRGGRSKRVSRIVVPTKYKPHILAANHLSHFGFMKTYNAIKEKFFWKNLYSDTKHYIASCKHCIAYRSPNAIPPVPLHRNYIPTRPMELVSCDYIGKLPVTRKRNCYILSFVDHFTKFIHLYATPDQTALTTAEKLLDFICIFGCPEFLLSDRGRNFTSDVFTNLCQKLGTTKLQTTALHPQTNGMSEKLNLNIKKSLSIFAQNTAQWDEYLNYYSLLYNSSFHSAVRDKPAYLHLAYDPLLPTDIINQAKTVTYTKLEDFVAEKTYQIQYTYQKVRDSLIEAAEKQEQYQSKSAKNREFYSGQLVYLYSPDIDRNASLPKRRNYTGPMRIIKCHNNKVNYTIQNPCDPKSKPTKVHINRLIPYVERRSELDLLHSLVQTDKQKGNEESTSDSVLNRPHATFDDVLETDLLPKVIGRTTTSRTNISVNESQGSNIETDTYRNNSPNSDTTEIYEFHDEQNSLSHNQQPTASVSHQVRSPYELRSLTRASINLADRIFDWSLKLTE